MPTHSLKYGKVNIGIFLDFFLYIDRWGGRLLVELKGGPLVFSLVLSDEQVVRSRYPSRIFPADIFVLGECVNRIKWFIQLSAYYKNVFDFIWDVLSMLFGDATRTLKLAKSFDKSLFNIIIIVLLHLSVCNSIILCFNISLLIKAVFIFAETLKGTSYFIIFEWSAIWSDLLRAVHISAMLIFGRFRRGRCLLMEVVKVFRFPKDFRNCKKFTPLEFPFQTLFSASLYRYTMHAWIVKDSQDRRQCFIAPFVPYWFRRAATPVDSVWINDSLALV